MPAVMPVIVPAAEDDIKSKIVVPESILRRWLKAGKDCEPNQKKNRTVKSVVDFNSNRDSQTQDEPMIDAPDVIHTSSSKNFWA